MLLWIRIAESRAIAMILYYRGSESHTDRVPGNMVLGEAAIKLCIHTE